MTFSDKKINILLLELGLPPSICHVQGFWNIYRGQLDDILAIAEKIYQRKRITLAPRTLTDLDEPVRALNELWMEIKKRFAWAMSPKLKLPKEKPAWTWQETRKCKLAHCSNDFIPKYVFQTYCSKRCQKTDRNLRTAAALPRFDKTCEICGNQFETVKPTKARCGDAVCARMHQKIRSHKAYEARQAKADQNNIIELEQVA